MLEGKLFLTSCAKLDEEEEYCLWQDLSTGFCFITNSKDDTAISAQ